MIEQYDMKYIPNILFAKNLFGMSEIRKKKNIDWPIGILGDEGSGKSNVGLLVCCFINPEFNVDNICFSPEQFIDAVDKAEHGDVILLDEGAEIFYSKTSLRKETVEVERLMLRIRFKELFIVINIPDFLLLTRDIRKRRIKTYIKTTLSMKGGELSQGKFKFYGGSKRKKIMKSPYGSTMFPTPDFSGNLPSIAKIRPELWADYLKKKAGYSKKKKESPFSLKRRKKILKMMDQSLTVAELVKIMGKSTPTVCGYLRGQPCYIWPKTAIFIGLDGKKRLRKKYYDAGVKRLVKHLAIPKHHRKKTK